MASQAGVGRPTALFVLVVALLLTSSVRTRGDDSLSLVIKDVRFPTGETVEFSKPVLDDDPLRDPSIRIQTQTQENVFDIGIDVNDTFWTSACGCLRFYRLLVRDRGGATTTFRFTATPRGVFRDRAERVSFQILRGSRKLDDGSVVLPIVSGPHLPEGALILEGIDAIQPVNLGSGSEIKATVRNTLDVDLMLSLTPVTPPSTSGVRSVTWVTAQTSGSPGRVAVRAGRKEELRLNVIPARWDAFQQSFLSVKADVPHAVIPISVHFANEALPDRTLPLTGGIGIRFRPLPLVLAAAVVCGVLAGSILRLARPKQRQSLQWWPSTGIALVAGICAEIVAILLVEAQSEFKLFGFKLDPWQSAQATMLGVLFGLLGRESVDAFKRLFDWESRS